LNLKLNYPQLVLGDKISLDTIDGTKILVTIPEHSEVGSNLRIPSKGLNILKVVVEVI
jgi:DnaJ-class molecular chaperone